MDARIRGTTGARMMELKQLSEQVVA